jgi:hypothetical protein
MIRTALLLVRDLRHLPGADLFNAQEHRRTAEDLFVASNHRSMSTSRDA